MTAPPELRDSKLSVSGRVALLEFDRHDLRNALTGTALAVEIATVAAWVNQAPEVSVLVITGNGTSFSSGGNVKDMRDKNGMFGGSAYEIQQGYRTGIQRMSLAMDRLEVPAIAAVNGPAIGAGLDLACMCDLRLASTEAVMGETFVNLGIVPGDGGAYFLQRVVGYQRAAELTFSGRLVKAEEALEIGLVLEVVEADRLRARALELAATIAAKPPLAVRLTKRTLRAGRDSPLEGFLDFTALLQTVCHQTADHAEAVSAFLEKREPEFQGQ